MPLAQGCEELEAVTIIDLLRRAGAEVVVAGLETGPVTASRGVVLVPDMTLDQALQREYAMVVLPGGGPGSERLACDRRILGLLQRMQAQGRYTAAICAAPKALLQAGLLWGRRATAYPGTLEAFPDAGVQLCPDAVVEDGPVITSRGPGTALDFALVLIERLLGQERRLQVAAGLMR